MNTLRALIVIPFVAALTACGASEAPPVSSSGAGASSVASVQAAPAQPVAEAAVPQVLEAGRSWTLVEASDERLQSVAEASGIFIEVQDTRWVGYAGCNRFSVSMHHAEGNAIKLEAIVSTKRACVSDALNAAEQRFLQALADVQHYELSAAGLRLSTADGATLSFIPGRPGGNEEDASQAEGS